MSVGSAVDADDEKRGSSIISGAAGADKTRRATQRASLQRSITEKRALRLAASGRGSQPVAQEQARCNVGPPGRHTENAASRISASNAVLPSKMLEMSIVVAGWRRAESGLAGSTVCNNSEARADLIAACCAAMLGRSRRAGPASNLFRMDGLMGVLIDLVAVWVRLGAPGGSAAGRRTPAGLRSRLV